MTTPQHPADASVRLDGDTRSCPICNTRERQIAAAVAMIEQHIAECRSRIMSAKRMYPISHDDDLKLEMQTETAFRSGLQQALRHLSDAGVTSAHGKKASGRPPRMEHEHEQ
jgi:hypothetical protein